MLYIEKAQLSIHRGSCFVGAAGISICRLFHVEKSFALSRHLKELSRFSQTDSSFRKRFGTLLGAEKLL